MHMRERNSWGVPSFWAVCGVPTQEGVDVHGTLCLRVAAGGKNLVRDPYPSEEYGGHGRLPLDPALLEAAPVAVWEADRGCSICLCCGTGWKERSPSLPYAAARQVIVDREDGPVAMVRWHFGGYARSQRIFICQCGCLLRLVFNESGEISHESGRRFAVAVFTGLWITGPGPFSHDLVGLPVPRYAGGAVVPRRPSPDRWRLTSPKAGALGPAAV